MIHPARQHLLDAIQRNSAVESDLFARVQSAAHDADTSPFSRRHPTQAQLEANSYRTGRVSVQGLPLRIESPRGTRREKPGKFSNLMLFHYGDIEGTVGNDGDPIDAFIGPFPELPVVYVVNQVGLDGAFDEHKVCMGFASEADARMGYLSAYAPGWDGLDSIVRATMAQFKWWLKFGDMSRPFTPDVLPYEGQATMDKVLWNSQAEPVTKPLNTIIYELRGEDSGHGLMLDALSMAELMADPDVEAVPVLDAMVVEVGRLQPKMEVLQRIMAAAGESVKPTEMAISDPVRYKGAAQVMVLFTMSDGQTVSVWFHNPDTTPAKLMPLDELISWKWMLNKKDVTIVVAPERGRDLNPREVSRRIMRLVERNSAAFLKANAKVAEKAAQLQALDTEIAELQTELTDVQRQIEVAKVEKETRVAVVADDPHYSDLILKALMDAGWKAGYFEGAGETGRMVSVSREFVGVGALGGMAVPDGMRRLFAGYSKDQSKRRYIVLTLGDSQIADWDGRDQDPGEVARLVNEAAEKYADQARLKNGLPALYGVAADGVPSFDDFLAAVVIELTTKGNMSAAEAKKLTDDEVTNLVRDGFDDKTPAAQVADQILAANKRTPAVERAYAIAGILMTQYGWSKSDENEYPESGILVDSPRDSSRWVFLMEEGGILNWDADQDISARSKEFTGRAGGLGVMADGQIAQGFDRADFEAETGTDDDGLIEDGEEFAGKTPAFAYAAEVLRKGAAAAGATVQFGDFSGSTTDALFDKATPSSPYAEVSVYGITAQIGAGGRVLARAMIDEKGEIVILKGTGGMDALGDPRDEAGVRQIVADLMAAEAAKPVPEPVPEPAPTPEPTDAETVDAAYKFANASDAFKSAVVGSIDQESYSPFLSAKNIDEAAKKHGASVTWRLAMVLDSVGESEDDEDSAGADDDFDAEAEFDACPADDELLDSLVLDGDFKGHPFRGSQYRKANQGSGSAVSSSMKAKHAEKHGDPKAQKKAHKTAYFSHMAAAEEAKGVTRSYHRKMAKFHGGRAGVVLDSVEESLILDDADAYESIVGTIKKGSKIVGRAHVGGDGKAMVFIGKTGNVRVQLDSGMGDGKLIQAMWSDDDAVFMVDALFTLPVNGVAKAVEPEPVVPSGEGGNPVSAVAEIIEGSMGAPGGFALTVGGLRKEFRSEEAEELVDNARENAVATGRNVTDVLAAMAMDDGWDKRQADAVHEPVAPAPAENDLTRLNALKKLVSKDDIRRDDPEAIQKLQAKLNYLVAYGDMMRKANKLVRKGDRDGLTAMGFNGRTLESLFEKDFAGRIGFADYMMTNNNGVIRTTRLRLEELQAAEMAKKVESPVEPAPTTEDQGTPMQDPQKATDTAYLQSLIDGTGDLLAEDTFVKLEPMFTTYEGDAAMMDLLERAANAYGDAAVEAAKQALAA